MTSSASPADLILGIDLGTTNSLIALCDDRGPRIIPDSAGRALLPSVVRIAENPATLADFAESVGHDARSHAVEFPHRTIYSVKRLIGRGFSDLAGDLRHLSYALQPGEHDSPRIIVNKRAYTPQQISAAILRELKSSAERALNQPVTKAVITVPAYFDDAQRQATRDAGRLAGLEVLRIVNEPTAAALAYGIGTRHTQPETIAVYDLGGGTFDISILTVTPSQSPLPPGVGEGGSEQRGGGEESGEGSSDTPSLEGGGEGVGEAHRSNSSAESSTSPSFFQVLSTAGDTHLGGDDFDQLIINLVLSEIRARFGTSLTFPPSTQQALRLFAESAKIRLSSHESADLRIDLGNSRIYSRTITRAEFESLIQPLIDRTILSCRRALKDAHLSPENINRVVMVGGSTRIPLVQKAVGDFFRCTPYTALDPDQVVALGASVQAAILSGSAKNMLLLDVIPLSLGIETVGGGVAKLIVRNSSVPARAVEMFSTSVDGQTNIKLHVLQGERELVKDCRSLATFELRGIPPMPAGIPQVEVEFLVDANGILSVNARERRSGKRAAIQVAPRYGLTREEVDRMESEAFAHARADMHAHRVIDLAVNAALDAKWITEALTRVSSELDPAYRAELSAALAHLDSFIEKSRTAPESVDADAFHRAKEDLDKTSMRLHEISIRKSLQSP